jgi:hypothetical protein
MKTNQKCQFELKSGFAMFDKLLWGSKLGSKNLIPFETILYFLFLIIIDLLDSFGFAVSLQH